MTASRKTPLLALAFASALFATAAGAQDSKPRTGQTAAHDMAAMQGHQMEGQSAGSMELHNIMMAGSKMPMKMSGNVDKDFATMMTMHHQQAIRMSDVLLKHGQNAELKALARKMQQQQKSEIKELAPHTK